MNNLDSLELLTRAVEAARADIAPGYEEYLQLALAIASDCGEAGRSYFHRLCAFSSKYRQKEAEAMFSNVLRSGRNQVHLGTAFYLARLAGVDVMDEIRVSLPVQGNRNGSMVQGSAPPHTHTRTREGTDNGGVQADEPLPVAQCEPLMPLPLFPDYEWPPLVTAILKYAKTAPQRDALWLGTMTVLGSSMERHVRCPYGLTMLYPCMQTFVVAPPASGKGILAPLRQLVLPIHQEVRGKYERERAQYVKDKAAYDAMGKKRTEMEPPVRPVNRMFLIPGNNSGTGILQNLIDSNGTGLLFEVEADTISTAIGSDYGHWSDTLRKAFDHAAVGFNRRSDDEMRESEESLLSMLISGTPGQVKPLIPSAENGLFSRQIFYYMPGTRKWQNQFDADDTDLKTLFRALGQEWKKRLDELKRMGLFTVRLSEAQKERFNERFDRLFDYAQCSHGFAMNSSVARLAIHLLRLLSVVAMLRADFKPDKDIASDNLKDGIITRWDVFVSDADFEAVMALMEPLYHHTTHILSMLPATEVTRREGSDADTFFSALPRQFNRAQFNDLVSQWGINKETAETWLKRALKRGLLEHREKRGEYQKLRL